LVASAYALRKKSEGENTLPTPQRTGAISAAGLSSFNDLVAGLHRGLVLTFCELSA
jgi:hypothetical protein